MAAGLADGVLLCALQACEQGVRMMTMMAKMLAVSQVAVVLGAPVNPSFIQVTGNACAKGENGVGVPAPTNAHSPIRPFVCSLSTCRSCQLCWAVFFCCSCVASHLLG